MDLGRSGMAVVYTIYGNRVVGSTVSVGRVWPVSSAPHIFARWSRLQSITCLPGPQRCLGLDAGGKAFKACKLTTKGVYIVWCVSRYKAQLGPSNTHTIGIVIRTVGLLSD